MFESNFFSDWAYYGTLTILLEIIIYLAFKIIFNEMEQRRKKRFLNENPEIAKLIEGVDTSELPSPDIGEVPMIAYLVYPRRLPMNTDNTMVVTTLGRAEDVSDPEDEILQVMFYPPNEKERKYYDTMQSRIDRAQIMYKYFEKELLDDESSSE